MKFRLKLLVVIYLFTFSGCSLLFKNRVTHHHGMEKNDYDLPVILYPASNPLIKSKRLLFIFSGDGGWLDFEDKLAIQFSKRRYNVIGFNSRSYFWEQRTPQQTTDDVILLINKYMAFYKTTKIYLCGYSFGADVVPFIYNHLPFDLQKKVVALELLSPFASNDFKIHASDLLNIAPDNWFYKVAPEIDSIKISTYCFYGEEEDPKPLNYIKCKNFILNVVPGNHHYELRDYNKFIAVFEKRNKLKK